MKNIKKYINFVNEAKEESYEDKIEKEQADDYAILNRLQSDCEYFLNWGNGSERNLYYHNIEDHILEMKKLWDKLIKKPEWLSYEQIEEYEKNMQKLKSGEIKKPEWMPFEYAKGEYMKGKL